MSLNTTTKVRRTSPAAACLNKGFIILLAGFIGLFSVNPASGQKAADRHPASTQETPTYAALDQKSVNSAYLQQKVTGTVTDSKTGETLIGVNVIVKGSKEQTGSVIGTQTGPDGTYSIEVPEGLNTLVFSYVGYQRKEVEINDRTEIDVALQMEVAELDEAVVVGFQKQERVNTSGAVDQIDAQQLEGRNISNLSQGLQGAIPNLNIDFLEGSPGAVPNINVRGFTSINKGDPLILIDGVPSEPRDLVRLDPKTVQSVSVLKDASSAAIYGARAAFGVVLIETKEGSKEGINISYSSRVSWDTPTVLPDKTNDPYIYMRLQDMSTSATPWNYYEYDNDQYKWARQRSNNPDAAPAVREDPDNPGTWEYMGNRDWTRYFLDEYTLSASNTLSIDGQTDNVNFYLSGTFDKQNGALKLDDDYYDRWGIRSKIEYKPYEWLRIRNNSYVNFSKRILPSRMSYGDDAEWAMWEFYNHAPMAMNKNPDGSWANTSVGRLASQVTEGGDLEDGRQLYKTTFSANADVVEQMFTVNADFTYRRELRNYNYDHQRYTVGFGPGDIRELGSTKVFRNRTTFDYYVFNLYGNFERDFGKHQISSVVGFNQEKNEEYGITTEIPNVISSNLPSLSLSLGNPNVSDEYRAWAVRGIFGRVNYIYDDRYILEFNGRYDGSSRFPENRQYGFFPSGSIAWRVDQESFMNQFDWLDVFKLRASYGALGNQSVAPFGHIPTMSARRADYIVGDSRPLSISSPGLVSPNYTWEEVTTKNLGLDIDLFKSKIMASFDVYQRRTKGMLTLGKELPAVLGAEEPRQNAANLKTNGWEASLKYRNQFKVLGDVLIFSSRFTLSDSRSWITKFDNPDKFLDQYYVGQEIGEIWGLQYEGLFESEEEIKNHADQSGIVPWGSLPIVPGWPKFKDLNGDGIIQAGDTKENPGDLSVIGNSQPRYRFGLNLNFAWKNFDVKMFFQGVGQRDFYPQHYLFWGFYQQPYDGGYTHLYDFYRSEDDPQSLQQQHSESYIDKGLHKKNTDAKYPVLQAWLTDYRVHGVGSIPNDKFLLDASYLRFKNLTIGYTLPASLLTGFGIRDMRIYISGENITEWSEVSQFVDPEAITDDGFGYRYPFQRKYSVGINVNF